MMNHEWLPVLADLSSRDVPCVLITVMSAKGSTPREAGTKMIVTVDAQYGTIGGGNLEFQAIEEARALLSACTTNVAVKDYPLGPALAQCCGGAVSVLLEPFIPLKKHIVLFGAGHVGREVVKVFDGLPVKIRWVDARAPEFPAILPVNCEAALTSAPLDEIGRAPEGSYFVIMTHSHDLDFDLTLAALRRNDFAYLGLIGSETKRAKFEKRLLAEGIAASALQRLTCPIGMAGITGKHPREIAVAVAAELLALGVTRAKRAGVA